MASRQEYNMLFQLNAKLGNNFTGTFSKAQQQLLSFQKEIQSLNKTQGEISSYEKQQQAVDATKKKLELLQQQYENIQKEIQETGGYSSDLENKLLSKQQQIDKTAASLEKQTQKLDQMGDALREAGVDTNNLGEESNRLGAEIRDLQRKEEEAAEGAESFGEQSTKAITTISEALTAAGIAAALHKIYEAYAECISVAGDFEASMSNVEALSGASAEDLQKLSELAKELGATTKFTAKESADAMGYMAMAGWNAEQMLAGMPGVLQLAAASGEDLAQVSDIVTDSMTAFGLTAADTSRYADVLAATAANANTSVGIMGETFKYAAPVAGALGYSIEDVSTAIGLMANAGIKGSNAGTALRNVFNGLLEGVTLTSGAFGEVRVSAVKADGTMADFATTIDELRGYFDQMTEAERVNNAAAIAGQRGYAGLLSILNASEEDYQKLTDAINNSTGAAQRMADVKMNNMVGQLTLLNSAWEALQTTVGEQFTPIMSDIYAFVAKTLSGINSFLQKHPALIKAITAFVAVIGTVVAAIMAYTVAAKAAAAASAALSAAIPGVNIIMGVAAAVAGLTAVIVGVTTSINDGIPSVEELTTAARDMQDTLKSVSSSCDDTVASTLAASNVAEDYISRLEALEAAGLSTTEEQKEYHNVLALLCDTVPELSQYIDLTTDTIEGGTNALRANTEAWKQNAIAQAYQDTLTELYSKYSDVLVESEKNSIKLQAAQDDLDKAEQKRQDTLARMVELEDEANEKAKAYYEEYGEWVDATSYLTQEYYDLNASLAGIYKEMSVARKSIETYSEAIEDDAEAVEAAREEIDLAEEAVANLTETTEDSTRAAEEAARQSEEMSETLTTTIEKVQSLTDAYNEAYNAASSSIKGQYDLWDEADDVVETSVGSMNSAIETQIAHWTSYNDNLSSLQDRAADIEGLSDVIASFADGSDESVAAIAGMASASDEDLAEMVKNWQELQQAQSDTSGTIAEFKTDFTAQMDELTQELAEDISSLDLSADAARNGQITIQAFIDAAEDMEPEVKAAYAKLGLSAVAAMRSSSGYGVVANSHGWAGNHYAVGTENASPGVALVGEQGPELMLMQGGEKVLNAAETKDLLQEYSEVMIYLPSLLRQIKGYSSGTEYATAGLAWVGEQGAEAVLREARSLNLDVAPASVGASAISGGDVSYMITLSPTYTISGSSRSDELEDMLREHDERLKAQVKEIIEDIEDDRRRCAYR